jgi:hypothetical protein
MMRDALAPAYLGLIEFSLDEQAPKMRTECKTSTVKHDLSI